MFSLLVLVLFAASGGFASRNLSLELDGASSFVGEQSVVITATLTNTGNEELVLLNDPRTVLSDLHSNIFAIVNEDGRPARFRGIVAKYVPEAATSTITLLPGDSVTVEHTLADAYDFRHSGPGVYRIEALSSTFLASTSSGIVEVFADTAAHIAHIAPELSFSDEQYPLSDDASVSESDDLDDLDDAAPAPRRPKFRGCSPARQKALIAAARVAQGLSRQSYNYLRTHSSTTRYRTWFGGFNAARHKKVLTGFQKINRRSFGTATYDCTCKKNDLYAYVYPGNVGETYLCPPFFRAATTGSDSQGGILVHEASHWTATADTDDHTYGDTNAKNLARRDPAKAVANADNFEFFAENNPALE